MNKILSLVYILIIFLLCNYSYSQSGSNINIKGKILDENNKPVEYANLTIQELSVSTISDQNGAYAFAAIPEGSYHLTINRAGFLNKTVKVSLSTAQQTLDIVMDKSLIETSTIDVTSSFNPTSITNSTFSITSIGPRTLSRTRSENIATTIQNIPGINNLSTGSSIGKPIIRGLSYQSVLVLHDGIKHESQLWGDEHGPEIPVFNIDRIEILRGPSSLIYGSDGIGGVVNIITKPLQFSDNKKFISYGGLTLNGFSANEEGVGNLNVGIGTEKFGANGYIGYREGKNITTPSGEYTVNTPEGQNVIQGGKLFNSGDKEFQTGINVGLKGSFGIINATYENFNRQLQLHEDPAEDPTATPNQKIVTNNFDIKGNLYLNHNLELEPIFSYEHQSRIEYESSKDKNENIQALNLDLNLYQGDLRLNHNLSKDIKGTLGTSLIIGNNKSLAEEKLIPNYNSTGIGLYIQENYYKKYFTLSGGIRFDNKNLNINETIFDEEKTIQAQSLKFNSFTGSFGGVYKPTQSVDIFANVGTGWRPPSEFELFVDGVHEGTGRFERGLVTNNPDYNPTPESSVNFDLGTRIRNQYFSGEVSIYNNFVNNFVFPSATDEIDSASGFQIYDILQDNSSFFGYEYNFQIQPVKWFLLTVKGDYVKTNNKAEDNPLPFTPPAKNIVELRFEKGSIGTFYNPYFTFGTKFVSEASQVGRLESSTPAYTLLNAGLGFDFTLSKAITSVDFSVTNLANTKYVDHLSRYRYYALNSGISFNLKIGVPFQF
ncbi:MAG: TonB-dependent receptor [bacterium]